MMKRWFAALAMASALAVAQSPQPQTPAPKSGVKQLTDDEIREAVEKKKVFLLDVREPKELESLGTVPGYVNIPLGQIESRLNEIPRDKLIITL